MSRGELFLYSRSKEDENNVKTDIDSKIQNKLDENCTFTFKRNIADALTGWYKGGMGSPEQIRWRNMTSPH